uniref:Uncharacterized protein n=1 Tax=Micrurus paraensis TaxID=1970185 RepID=A0A2D4L7C4_9SAUR
MFEMTLMKTVLVNKLLKKEEEKIILSACAAKVYANIVSVLHLLQVGSQIQVLEEVCQPLAEFKLGQGKAEDWESCKASDFYLSKRRTVYDLVRVCTRLAMTSWLLGQQ